MAETIYVLNGPNLRRWRPSRACACRSSLLLGAKRRLRRKGSSMCSTVFGPQPNTQRSPGRAICHRSRTQNSSMTSSSDFWRSIRSEHDLVQSRRVVLQRMSERTAGGGARSSPSATSGWSQGLLSRANGHAPGWWHLSELTLSCPRWRAPIAMQLSFLVLIS